MTEGLIASNMSRVLIMSLIKIIRHGGGLPDSYIIRVSFDKNVNSPLK